MERTNLNFEATELKPAANLFANMQIKTVQPKNDIGLTTTFQIIGNNVNSQFTLVNKYLQIYGAFVVNGLTIQATGTGASVKNVKGLMIARPRIDGLDDTNITFYDFSEFQKEELATDTLIKVPLRFLITCPSIALTYPNNDTQSFVTSVDFTNQRTDFESIYIQRHNPNYNICIIVFNTAPSSEQTFNITCYVESIPGQIKLL